MVHLHPTEKLDHLALLSNDLPFHLLSCPHFLIERPLKVRCVIQRVATRSFIEVVEHI